MSKEIIIDGVVYVPKDTTPIVEEKTTFISIKDRFTGDIIFQSTKTTIRDAVIEACKNAREANTDADLTDANLTGANLTRADLTGANLTDADLTRADLTRANLTGANLTGANLTDADLTRANLTGANLTGANLTDADLNGCLFYMGAGNRNFAALCKAIKTIKHQDGSFDNFQ